MRPEEAETVLPSGDAVVNADGRFVAFSSLDPALVAEDTNGTWDVFVRDCETRVVTRVSVRTDGLQGNGSSGTPAISADGRYVAFASLADTLVRADRNGAWDIFVHDRVTGITERASVDVDGLERSGGSAAPSLSHDGRYVAFESVAEGLVADDSNGVSDVFVRDRVNGTLERVSAHAAGGADHEGAFAPALNADGRYVAFEQAPAPGGSTGWMHIVVYDRITGHREQASAPAAGDALRPSLSANGRIVAFESNAATLVAGDGNGAWDVFVRHLDDGVTERVSVDNFGVEGNGDAWKPSVSASGRYVTYSSTASNLVPTDGNNREDVFVHDRWQGRTARVSVNALSGAEANSTSHDAHVAAGGQHVVFESLAGNLGAIDTNGTWDAYLLTNPLFEDAAGFPVADAGPDQVVECSGMDGTAVLLDGTGSRAADGGTGGLAYLWLVDDMNLGDMALVTVLLPSGTHTVTLIVTDEATLGTDTDTVTIEVVDTSPPELALALTPDALWPPNHKFVLVTPIIDVWDACDPAPMVELTDITMSDASDTRGAGHTDDDFYVTEGGEIYLRAERSGTGEGRLYTITYTATDGAGNVATASATVAVAHHQ